MAALNAYLYGEWEKELWRSYQSEMLRMIGGALGGKNIPKFEALISEGSGGKEMTQEQVMERRAKLLDKLRMG